MKKLMSLILALAMAFALSVPAFAEGTTTTVTLDLLPTNTYTLTVPAATVLNKDGSAVALTNGLKVSNGDLASDKKVVVTASADSGWKMSATGATTKVGYGLYAQANDSDTTTAWEYSAEEANTGDTGTTKTVYAKANTTDVAAAAHGEYSDVVTFVGAVDDAVTFAFRVVDDPFDLHRDGFPTDFKSITKEEAEAARAFADANAPSGYVVMYKADDFSEDRNCGWFASDGQSSETYPENTAEGVIMGVYGMELNINKTMKLIIPVSK